MVAEDSLVIRAVLVEQLQSRGYRVIEAGDGEEAMRLVEGDAAPDLLLTDLVMPRMGGSELAERLTGRFPGLKVLFISGHAQDLRRLEGQPNALFVQKPFATDLLARRIRALLEPLAELPAGSDAVP